MPLDRIPVYFPHARAVQPSRALPLALGMLRAHARVFRGGTLEQAFEFAPLRSVLTAASGADAPPGCLTVAAACDAAPGIWLFTDYLWSVAFNLELSRAVKARDPRNLTIHGGPSVPKYPDASARFLAEHHGVDVAVRGEGESTCAELLHHFAAAQQSGVDWREGLAAIDGISFRADAAEPVVRTPDRERRKELDALPSPYLDGTFVDWALPNPRLATIETNRGCPYGCTFCDWGSATQQKIHLFDLERVKDEITWVARHEIPILFIADANFGIFDRDVAIAEHVGAMRRLHGFPRELQVSYAKNGDQRIAEIVRVMVSAGVSTQGIVSIQTTDPTTLRAVRRTNIKTENYQKLAGAFRTQGLPISTDLMLGLPGATLQSHKDDLQFFFDEDIPVKAYRTRLLPNSPMADPAYIAEHAIRVDADGFVIATATASEADLREVFDLVELYESLEKASLLRYVLRFLQWEHGVPALEFVHRLSRAILAEPDRFPAFLQREHRNWRGHLEGVFEAPDAFYTPTWLFARDTLGLPVETDAAISVWQLNAALVPRRGQEYPIELASPWDFVHYFRDCRAPAPGEQRRLERRAAPLHFTIRDPENYAAMDFRRLDLFNDSLRFFELEWPARRIQGAAAMHEMSPPVV